MTASTHPSLFDPVESDRRKRRGQARSASAHADTIARLVPIARELAAKVGEAGIIFADIRRAGEERHILTGREQGRALSFGPAVMRSAGLTPTGQRRNSPIVRSHGNSQLVYVLPEYARGT